MLPPCHLHKDTVPACRHASSLVTSTVDARDKCTTDFYCTTSFHLVPPIIDVPNAAWQVQLLPSNLENFEVPSYGADTPRKQHTLSKKWVSMQMSLSMCI